jgi:hypothetical protein
MELENLNVRLVKLPPDIELVLFPINEELKTTTLFNGLAQTGLEDCYFQSHFDTLVLALIGFDKRPDDLHQFYTNLIDEYSEEIEAYNDIIMRCIFEVYVEIVVEKKRKL